MNTNQDQDQNRGPYQFSFEKFDKELFEKNRSGFEYRYKDGEYTIRLMGSSDYYTKEVISGVYAYKTIYYKKELTVKQTAMTIYSMTVGSLKYYDAHGNLIKTDDRDTPFHFTVEDVVHLVKEKYGVDMLVDKYPNSMDRSRTPYPYYILMFMIDDGKIIRYCIDGVDGTIYFHSVDDEIIMNDDNYLWKKVEQKAESEKK